MAGQERSRTSSNLTRIGTRPPPPAPRPPARPPSGDGKGGNWLFGALLIGVVILVGRCSNSSAPTSVPSVSAATETAQQALVQAVDAQTPPPVRPLDRSRVRRGFSRVALASVEGLAGEMIYSQNCYDVLGRDFSWAKLDECGGFDVEAAKVLGDTEMAGAERETAWFDGEAAAGRYLKSATAAGMEADLADRRLETLRTVAKERVDRLWHRADPAAKEPSPTSEPDEPSPVVGNEGADVREG